MGQYKYRIQTYHRLWPLCWKPRARVEPSGSWSMVRGGGRQRDNAHILKEDLRQGAQKECRERMLRPGVVLDRQGDDSFAVSPTFTLTPTSCLWVRSCAGSNSYHSLQGNGGRCFWILWLLQTKMWQGYWPSQFCGWTSYQCHPLKDWCAHELHELLIKLLTLSDTTITSLSERYSKFEIKKSSLRSVRSRVSSH